MNIVRWVTSALLLLLSLMIGLGQWWAIYSIPKKKNAQGQLRNYSMIPLFGGLLGTVGCFVAPSPVARQFWWVPLFIDPGCALLFGLVAVVGVIAGVKRLLGRHSD